MDENTTYEVENGTINSARINGVDYAFNYETLANKPFGADFVPGEMVLEETTVEFTAAGQDVQ